MSTGLLEFSSYFGFFDFNFAGCCMSQTLSGILEGELCVLKALLNKGSFHCINIVTIKVFMTPAVGHCSRL